jgi:hypothetical protein
LCTVHVRRGASTSWHHIPRLRRMVLTVRAELYTMPVVTPASPTRRTDRRRRSERRPGASREAESRHSRQRDGNAHPSTVHRYLKTPAHRLRGKRVAIDARAVRASCPDEHASDRPMRIPRVHGEARRIQRFGRGPPGLRAGGTRTCAARLLPFAASPRRARPCALLAPPAPTPRRQADLTFECARQTPASS